MPPCRGLTIAAECGEREFLFVGGDDWRAGRARAGEFRLERIPNLGTVFKNFKVDFGATISRALPASASAGKHVPMFRGLRLTVSSPISALQRILNILHATGRKGRHSLPDLTPSPACL